MIYPKPQHKKKRKQHGKSIFYQRPGTCFICERQGDYSPKYTEIHHIFDGPNRHISEAYGFTVRLCLKHHREGNEAVHNNSQNMRILQQIAQGRYEQTHSRKEFMDLIGKNYLD